MFCVFCRKEGARRLPCTGHFTCSECDALSCPVCSSRGNKYIPESIQDDAAKRHLRSILPHVAISPYQDVKGINVLNSIELGDLGLDTFFGVSSGNSARIEMYYKPDIHHEMSDLKSDIWNTEDGEKMEFFRSTVMAGTRAKLKESTTLRERKKRFEDHELVELVESISRIDPRYILEHCDNVQEMRDHGLCFEMMAINNVTADELEEYECLTPEFLREFVPTIQDLQRLRPSVDLFKEHLRKSRHKKHKGKAGLNPHVLRELYHTEEMPLASYFAELGFTEDDIKAEMSKNQKIVSGMEPMSGTKDLPRVIEDSRVKKPEKVKKKKKKRSEL